MTAPDWADVHTATTRSAELAGLSFHHFGLAVRDPADAFRMLQMLGYAPGRQAFDPAQRVNLAMRHHAVMPDVEVIWPGDGPSPIDKMIKGGRTMIYHLCYSCPDPDVAIDAFEAAGLQVMPVSPAKPSVLFDGDPVSFHFVTGFGLIEMLHQPPA